MTNRRSLSLNSVRNDRARATPQNGLAIDAVLSRVGVLEYTDASGKTHKEYRSADEVFSAESVNSLKNATITVEHPQEQHVTSTNFKKYTVGHVGEDVRREGDMLVGTLHINDEDTLEAILEGKLLDLSPGYAARIEAQAGLSQEHGAFDAMQTDIRYNHISLLPPGEGRQGPEVSLRLDAKGEAVLDYSVTTREDSIDMNPEELSEKMAAVVAQVAELKEGLGAMQEMQAGLAALQEAVAGLNSAPALDSEEEPKLDEEGDDPIGGIDEELKLDEEGDDPIGGIDEELKLDEDEAVEKRLDARVLEAVRAYEKTTGKTADLSKSVNALLREAAAEVGMEVRTDSTRDRLLGSLEAVASMKSSTFSPRFTFRKDPAVAPVKVPVTHEERVAAWHKRNGGK